jgi:hypothetical protein
MNIPNEVVRLSQLLGAFAEIAASRGDVQLRGSAEPPPLGYAVRVQPEPTSPGVELVFSLDGAKLCSWSSDGRVNGSDSADRGLEIDLRDGFRWECLLFPDAQTMALALLQRLLHELESCSEV